MHATSLGRRAGPNQNMNSLDSRIADLLRHSGVSVVFGNGSLNKLGIASVDVGMTRVLLVTDPGIVRAGHAQRALNALRSAGVEVTLFDGVCENPTTREVEAGLLIARELGVDGLIGLGGGSSMDCAKGINFLLTNGGRMRDYWGVGKAALPMRPLICVPTTAGTGSEAQSFALITDPDTHQKMACGDPKALPRVAILDPELTDTIPAGVAAATGIDAVAHAIETAVCRVRTAVSLELSRAAWRLLDGAFDMAMRRFSQEPNDAPPSAAIGATADMLLGAHLAGAAIEKSMLGAAHACANPLTSMHGVTHGVAVGLMLPHVIRFNTASGGATSENPYAELIHDGRYADAESLARRVEQMLELARLPREWSELGVDRSTLPEMARMAAEQWTARFNPREVDAESLLELYEIAFNRP